MNIEIKEYSDFYEKEILNLYKGVGWVNYTNNPIMLKSTYENSLKILCSYNNESLVGIIRTVDDGLSILYIQYIFANMKNEDFEKAIEKVTEIINSELKNFKQ